MGFVCIYFFCNFTYKPVKMVHDRFIFLRAKQTNHCNEIRITWGFFPTCLPLSLYHLQYDASLPARGEQMILKNTTNVSESSCCLWWLKHSLKKQKGHSRANSTTFLNFYPQNIWDIKWTGNGVLDKQKLQIIQDRV